jgi:hypothetical protein
VPDHLIRLRGGWNLDDAPRPVTLPMPLPLPHGGSDGRIRLSRRFGLPPFDPSRESLSLRLSRVAGLASARLNGREVARPSPGTSTLVIPLPDPLPRRNLLVLEVDLAAAGTPDGPWGDVALAIAAAPPGDDALGGGGGRP